MLTFLNEYCRIQVDTEASVLYLTWLEQPHSEEFKACYTRGLDMAVANRVTSVISDNSIGINLDMATQRWVAEVSALKPGQSHIRRYARVVPVDAFQEMVTYKIGESYNSMSESKIQFEVFHNLEKARRWVLSGKTEATEKKEKDK